MKKTIIFIFIIFSIVTVWSQAESNSFKGISSLDYYKLDISNARVSFMSYNLYHISRIFYDGSQYNLLVEYDGKDSFSLITYYKIDENSVRSVRPDFRDTRIKISEDNLIHIDNAIMFQKRYSIDLKKAGEEKLKIVNLNYTDVDDTIPNQFNSVLSSFIDGTFNSGNWEVSDSILIQNDDNQLFSKYVIELNQKYGEYKYIFNAKAEGADWIGYGLHFDVTGSKINSGYGLGESYLIWFTKDLSANKNNGTYIELYRSYTDTKMIKVASQLVNKNIEDKLNIEIYYNVKAHLISVIIDKEMGLSLMPNEKIMDFGEKIAFRTLGAKVEFSDLKILGK